jgi:hypothetical protein
MELLAGSKAGKILTEALDRCYSRQLNKHADDTLLSRLLMPEQH